MPPGIYGDRNWTRQQLSKLEDLLSQGFSDAEIGQRLGRSANAVNIIRKRHQIPSRYDVLLTARNVQRRLGLKCSKTVAWWIDQGYLKARRGTHRGKHRMRLVEDDDLLAFLEDRRYWHLWQPENLRDRAEREWAVEMRCERYLTTGEVGKRYGVISNTVHSWIVRGLLPAMRSGNWRVSESALKDFVPPYSRSKAGQQRRPFTADEDKRLLVLRVEGGWQWTQIAKELGRTISSVHGRYERLTR